MYSNHKGNEGEALFVFLGIEADEEFNPVNLVPQLFYEFNFSVSQLEYIASKATCGKGAKTVSEHPNATPKIKALLGLLLLEAESNISDMTL